MKSVACVLALHQETSLIYDQLMAEKNQDKKKRGRGKQTTNAELFAMIIWLRDPDHFNLMMGAAAKGPVVAGSKLRKVDAYNMLAQAVNDACNSGWTKDDAKSRYQAFYKKYCQTKRESQRTGFGVTDQDRRDSIQTVEQKLNRECRYFTEMDALFGGRGNSVARRIRQTDLIATSSPTPHRIDDDGFIGVSFDHSGDSDLENDQDFIENEEATLADTDPAMNPSSTMTPVIAPIAITPSRPTSAKGVKRDISSAFIDMQETSMKIRREELTLKKLQSTEEMEMKQRELQLREHEIKMKAEQGERDRKEETKRSIWRTLIEQGYSAQDAKQYVTELLTEDY